MSDFSGEHGFIPEWMGPALLAFGVIPLAVVKLCGGSWGTLAAGWGVLLLLAGLAVLGWRLWGWVRGWRTDRVLRREEADGFDFAGAPDNLKEL